MPPSLSSMQSQRLAALAKNLGTMSVKICFQKLLENRLEKLFRKIVIVIIITVCSSICRHFICLITPPHPLIMPKPPAPLPTRRLLPEPFRPARPLPKAEGKGNMRSTCWHKRMPTCRVRNSMWGGRRMGHQTPKKSHQEKTLWQEKSVTEKS